VGEGNSSGWDGTTKWVERKTDGGGTRCRRELVVHETRIWIGTVWTGGTALSIGKVCTRRYRRIGCVLGVLFIHSVCLSVSLPACLRMLWNTREGDVLKNMWGHRLGVRFQLIK